MSSFPHSEKGIQQGRTPVRVKRRGRDGEGKVSASERERGREGEIEEGEKRSGGHECAWSGRGTSLTSAPGIRQTVGQPREKRSHNSPLVVFQSDEGSRGQTENKRRQHTGVNPKTQCRAPSHPVLSPPSSGGVSRTKEKQQNKRQANTGRQGTVSGSPRVGVNAYARQMVFGVRELPTSMTSSRWLHMATNRSKKSLLPPRSISACMVPLLLNVLRHRMIRAR
jgi:hypothetical protein